MQTFYFKHTHFILFRNAPNSENLESLSLPPFGVSKCIVSKSSTHEDAPTPSQSLTFHAICKKLGKSRVCLRGLYYLYHLFNIGSTVQQFVKE